MMKILQNSIMPGGNPRTTHLKPISKEFYVQVPFQSPWHSQFLWRLMGMLSLRKLKMCWSQTKSEPSTAQQSWRFSNRLPEKMFRPFWNTWGLQLGLFSWFYFHGNPHTLGQNPNWYSMVKRSTTGIRSNYHVLTVIPDSQFHWSYHVIIFNSQCQCHCSLYTHKII